MYLCRKLLDVINRLVQYVEIYRADTQPYQSHEHNITKLALSDSFSYV